MFKRVEILYFEGCPNHEPAVRRVADVARELGVDVEIAETDVETPEHAQAMRFLGSPTIRVDGVDIEPSARSRTDFGYSCRTYAGSGVPSRPMIAAALTGNTDALRDLRIDSNPSSVRHGALDRGHRDRSLLVAGGAVAAAAVASACCWLPLIFLGFGVSLGGVGLVFEQTRPFVLTIAGAALGISFYYAYVRKEECEPGAACGSTRGRRLTRVLVWIAAAGVLAFALFPQYAGAIVPTNSNATTVSPSASVDTVQLTVSGLSCASCSATVEHEIRGVPGVIDAAVHYESGMAEIVIDAARRPSTEHLIEAVQRAGYAASSET